MAQRIDFGFTQECAGDLGYVWDGKLVAMVFTNSMMVHDIVKGGAPYPATDMADACNIMLKLAAKYNRPL